jgi:hypothetical protein
MSQMRSSAGGKVGKVGDGTGNAKAVDGAENARTGRKNTQSLRQHQERQEADNRRDKLAASSSHLRSSNKTTLEPSNDGGGHRSSDWDHGRRHGRRRNSDGPTSAVPYVTFGGDGQDMSDAGLSSLHSDLALLWRAPLPILAP